MPSARRSVCAPSARGACIRAGRLLRDAPGGLPGHPAVGARARRNAPRVARGGWTGRRGCRPAPRRWGSVRPTTSDSAHGFEPEQRSGPTGRSPTAGACVRPNQPQVRVVWGVGRGRPTDVLGRLRSCSGFRQPARLCRRWRETLGPLARGWRASGVDGSRPGADRRSVSGVRQQSSRMAADAPMAERPVGVRTGGASEPCRRPSPLAGRGDWAVGRLLSAGQERGRHAPPDVVGGDPGGQAVTARR